MIGQPLDHVGGEVENLFRVPEQASENGFTPFVV